MRKPDKCEVAICECALNPFNITASNACNTSSETREHQIQRYKHAFGLCGEMKVHDGITSIKDCTYRSVYQKSVLGDANLLNISTSKSSSNLLYGWCTNASNDATRTSTSRHNSFCSRTIHCRLRCSHLCWTGIETLYRSSCLC
jgi:hypothetical protein